MGSSPISSLGTVGERNASTWVAKTRLFRTMFPTFLGKPVVNDPKAGVGSASREVAATSRFVLLVVFRDFSGLIQSPALTVRTRSFLNVGVLNNGQRGI